MSRYGIAIRCKICGKIYEYGIPEVCCKCGSLLGYKNIFTPYGKLICTNNCKKVAIRRKWFKLEVKEIEDDEDVE